MPPELIEPPAPVMVETPAVAEPDYFESIIKGIESGKINDEPPVVEPPVKEPVVPPVEKPPVEADPDDVKPPENMSKKATEHWDELKTQSRSYKDKAIAAEAAIAEKEANWATERAELQQKFEEASAASGELVELRQRREAFEAAEKEFSVYSVERTADFQNTIVKPLKAIDERLEAISKAASVPVDRLADAISEPDFDKQEELLEALAAELSPVQLSRLTRMSEDVRSILDRRTEILTNAHEAQKELKERGEKETTAQKEAAAKEFKASVKNTVDSLVQRLPFVELADGETKEGVFKSILDKAEAEDFDKATPATKGTAAVSVVALERATRQLQKQAEYIATLEARVKEGTAAAPALGGGDTPKIPDKQEEGLEFLKIHAGSYTTRPMEIL